MRLETEWRQGSLEGISRITSLEEADFSDRQWFMTPHGPLHPTFTLPTVLRSGSKAILGGAGKVGLQNEGRQGQGL